MEIYWLGAEQGGWRRLLAAEGVVNVGMSYWSWRKRIPKRGVDIGSYGFEGVLLESGGYQANQHPEKHTQGEWRAYAEEFAGFAHEHIDDLTLVSEFDCLALGPEWIRGQRAAVWSDIDPDKFLPVWHPSQGLPALEELGELYPRISIAQDAVDGKGLNITPHLNALARKGVRLHGSAITKPDVLRQVQFATAASTSWLSPTQYGDTQWWENGALHRYPVKMKQQARLRHRAAMEQEGFDGQLVLDDDNTEVTRVALWSWRQLEASLDAHHGVRSNTVVDDGFEVDLETGEVAVDTGGPAPRNDQLPVPVLQQRPEDGMKTLPMFGTRQVQEVDPETRKTIDVEVLEVRGTSARRCDVCVIKANCPEMKPNTTCAYSIPVAVRTKSERAALMTGLVEMQTQRVQFGSLVEQVNGGYADPNLSGEMDRLLKILSTQADLEGGSDFLKISVESRGGAGGGILSQIFGAGAGQRAMPQAPPMRQIEADEVDSIAQRALAGKKVT